MIQGKNVFHASFACIFFFNLVDGPSRFSSGEVGIHKVDLEVATNQVT